MAVFRKVFRCVLGAFVALGLVFITDGMAYAACTSDQIDVAGDGTNCVDTKFTLTTNSTNSFQFNISAAGTFYVDCGTGGSLSGTGASGKTITRSNTNVATYTCSWSGSVARTIQFGGSATDYTTTTGTASISFYTDSTNAAKVASLSGSLGQIFSAANGKSPSFYRAFRGCTGLTSLPAGLFSGLVTSTTATDMFNGTFRGCTGLTSIPAGLFSGINTSAATNTINMFSYTFGDCTGLNTAIPSGLFNSINTSSATNTSSMFKETFYNCRGLTGAVPAGLFDSIDTSASTNTSYMFQSTFSSCSSLTSIPTGLFSGISSPAVASAMFSGTFTACTNLASFTNGNDSTNFVPANFLSNITNSDTNIAQNMFNSTALASSCPADTTDVTPNRFSGAGKPWCEEIYKFKLTTSATNSFQFNISAAGNFIVDCGTGGTLSSTANDVSGNTITRSDVTIATYTCGYSDSVVRTIKFGGQATGYSTGNTAAIKFYTNNSNAKKITGISGSLGAIFGTVATPSIGQSQPKFYQTFQYASNMTGSIPENLFGGISGAPTSYMFANTFSGCSGLTGSIPANLFGNISGAPAEDMFSSTFSGCSGLSGSIPVNLFSGISGAPARSMFSSTFHGCSGLTGSIPANLFAGISGAPAIGMFSFTFYNCSGLTGSIPANLFAGISGAPAENMFSYTFYGCSRLTRFTDGTISTTYVPYDFLTGITNGNTSYQVYQMFYGTGLVGSCPSETTNVTRAQFNNAGKPWCAPDINYNITYVLNGGTNNTDNPQTYHVGNSITLLPPTRDGYTFMGWCTDSGLTDCAITQWIAPDASGDKTFYAKWESTTTTKFVLTTSATDSFQFNISAAGNFIVDCGTGGTLSSTANDVSGNTITRSNVSEATYTCGYSDSVVRTIRFWGTATGYSTNGTKAAISFYAGANNPAQRTNAQKITGISGSLGAIFGTVANPTVGQSQPRFYSTFYYASNMIGSIPANLFAGISGAPATYMFEGTFSNCTGLTGSIPANLFAGISGAPANDMFAQTFLNCSGLTGSIPATLFSGISGAPAEHMFAQTFSGCTGLNGSIPANLFSGISGAPANHMFTDTFTSCTGLTGSIPVNLFAGIHGAPAPYMFMYTFNGCSRLNGFTDGTTTTSYIPGTFLTGITDGTASNMVSYMFDGTGLASGCPSGTTNVTRSQFSGAGKPWCGQNYTITYILNSGTNNGNNPSSYAAGAGATLLAPTRSGYIFDGWCDNDALTSNCSTDKVIPISATGNKTFYAKWQQMPKNITYVLNGGTNNEDNPTTYFEGTGATLYAPTKNGYLFGGWCTSSSLSNCEVHRVIPTSATGDKAFYAKWIVAPFELTTTETDEFYFKISAAGTFYVDCGDDGYLYDDDEGEQLYGVIERSNVGMTTYACYWDDEDVHTIKFGGTATGYDLSGRLDRYDLGYDEGGGNSPISFADNSNIDTISGSLGQIFGTLPNGTNPAFIGTFAKSSLSGTIPANLFSGISGAPAKKMFAQTFQECTNLTGSIPATLFSSISGAPAVGVFAETFYGCSGLTGSIPATLFSGISGAPAEGMFRYTFSECSGLTGSIPATLFSGISGAPAEGMFAHTFEDCRGLSGFTDGNKTMSFVPGNFLSGITSENAEIYAEYMFADTGLDDSCPTGVTDVTPSWASDAGKPWCQVVEYNITYVMNGGTNDARNPSTYVGGAPMNLRTPSRDGYTFLGWCSDSALTDCDTQPLSTATTGNKTFYAKWQLTPFTITTSSTDSFSFTMSAAGVFYIDWGNDYVEEIDRTGDTDEATYSAPQEWGNGRHTISISGTATGYSTDPTAAAISFSGTDASKVLKIAGSFGTVFPTIANPSVGIGQPRFYQTFSGCTNLNGTIPSTLFDGISGAPVSNMFYQTFRNCQSLTGTISSNLFAGIHGAPAEGMFMDTFWGCTGLTGTIPSTLFCQNPSSPSANNCIFGAPAPSMFKGTFSNCIGLSGAIPAGLFAGISGAPADYMFNYTFHNCLGLNGINDGANTTNYVPESFLGNVTAATAPGQATSMFANTGLATTCPTGLTNVTRTQFNDAGAVWCGVAQGTSIYNITYNMNGGTNNANNPTFYADDIGVTLAAPTRDGYMFAGWCTDAQLSNCAMTQTIPTGASGAKTFWAKWIAAPFTVTTTATNYFDFAISAAGTFYIDCGDGGRLYDDDSGAQLTNNTINRNSVGHMLYWCDWDNSVPHTIKFGGTATGYSTSATTPAITFIGNTYIAGISGSLGAIFGTVANPMAGTIGQPRFYRTFEKCSNLTGSIPANLFSGISGTPASYMFADTFADCAGLTGSIPANLFAGISGAPAERLFARTFYGCSGLTGPIPANLFSGISGAPANSMFDFTFYGCSGLTGSIPANLFGGISGAPADNMFFYTFTGCSGLTGSIPANLFSGISGPTATEMFESTFKGCRGLDTFKDGDGKPTSYVPASFLSGITSGNETSPAVYMFNGTGLDDECPSGTMDVTPVWASDAERPWCQKIESKFTVTTTETDEFYFNISAAGTFYVDCGNGGTLYDDDEGEELTDNMIQRNNVGATSYHCSWDNEAVHTVRFGGQATGYNNENDYTNNAAISFEGFNQLTGISGSLGAIFPTLSNPVVGIAQPSFVSTFHGCNKLTGSIPANLFDGITGAPVAGMFSRTFYNCFRMTGSIPATLFSGISGAPAGTMFAETFYGCSGLTGSIPANLFSGISGAPAGGMFEGTFAGCDGLTGSIPANLFAGISGAPANYMFQHTFNGCSGLTSIPKNLFSGISGELTGGEFTGTFQECTNLSRFTDGNKTTSYIPAGFLDSVALESDDFEPISGMFYDTALDDSCPTGTSDVTREYFDTGKPWCAEVPTEPEFTVTTSATNSFQFSLSAAGTFWVDCGTGGTLSGTGVSGTKITRTNTNYTEYTCSYSNSTPRTIGFSGQATGYGNAAAIKFYTNSTNTQKITGISGSLGAIFGTIGQSQPQFTGTFEGASNMAGSIPTNLFAGIYGAPVGGMFAYTFYGCSGLTGSIPANLFAGISGAPAEAIFDSTFWGCTGLTGSIPANLFSGISGTPANNMFMQTFYGCRGLIGSIPATLFSGISGAPADEMFSGTFDGCSGLTGSIPENLFSGISGAPADSIFNDTFNSCSGLNSFSDANNKTKLFIPSNFLNGITDGNVGRGIVDQMFINTGLASSCPVGTSDVTRTQFNNAGKPWCGLNVSGAIGLDSARYAASDSATGTAAGTTVSPATVYTKYDTGVYTSATDANSGTDAIVNLATLPVQSGYVFDGFFTGKAGTGTRLTNSRGEFLAAARTAVTGANATATWYAHYVPDANTYTITYNMNGGTNNANNPAYYVSANGATLNAPTRDGYIFGGWCTDAELTNCSGNDTIAAGTTGAKTFWAKWAEVKFTVTTKSTDEFSFYINATGTFYIDWGDGTVETVVSQNLGRVEYSHNYNDTGVYNVRLGGTATNYDFDTMEEGLSYDEGDTGAAISFVFNQNIDSISGSLGQIFGTLPNGKQPLFSGTFAESSLSGTIPANLFSGITGAPAVGMFKNTFWGCSGLTGSIPANLFSGITGAPADGMFADTFNGCSGLTGSIPANLFSGISGAPAAWMFYSTFNGCSGLTGSIPATLFSGISGAPAKYMFASTFDGCSGLTGSIPANLFSGISGTPANHMFHATFIACSGLTGSIPATLFSGISGAPANSMFYATFYGCTGLTGSIPATLFSGISGAPAEGMFIGTFYTCTGLNQFDNNGVVTSFVPATFLNGITDGNATSQVRNMFTNTGLAGACPSGTTTVTRSQFSDAGKPWCQKDFDDKFTLTTSATNSFNFDISAAGTFLVDCGTGGTLSGTGVSGNTITRSDVTNATYTCGYSDSAVRTIKFAGQATGYAETTATIKFYVGANSSEKKTNAQKITGISGSLGAIFGTVANPSTGQSQPRFSHTFYGASNMIGSIPENLFAGVSGTPTGNMFANTFDGCSGLTGSIPENLFSGISGAPANSMFSNTFAGCTGLTGSIPENLFSGISGAPAEAMFSHTFDYCPGLTGSIPAGLFTGISGAPADFMFDGTFYDCSGLTGSIPATLFAGISGAAAESMFANIFNGCSGLTGFTDGTTATNYVPASFLSDITDTRTGDGEFSSMFEGTALASTCPAGTYDVTSEAQAEAGKPWCSPCASGSYTDTDGETMCNACPFGTTTNGLTGQTSCEYACPESISTGVRGWADAEWNSDNTVTGLCEPNACEGGYYPVQDADTEKWSCASCADFANGTYPHSPTGGVSVYRVENELEGDGRKACFLYRSEINGSYIKKAFDDHATQCEPGFYSSYPTYEEVGNDGISTQAIHYGETFDCKSCENNTYSTGGATSCTACIENYTTIGPKTSAASCKIHCPGGSYLARPNDTQCTSVGNGFWSLGADIIQGTTSERNGCKNGFTTIGFGVGADEAGDCGRIFHAGDDLFYLRSVKKTTPSFNVQIGNYILYGNMSTADYKMSDGMEHSLRVTMPNGTVWSVYDDSGEVYVPPVPDVPQISLNPNTAPTNIVPNPTNFNAASGMNWSASVGDVNLTGHGKCHSTIFSAGTLMDGSFEPSGSGSQCFCKIDTPVESSRWVAANKADTCSTKCGYFCANNMNGTKAKAVTFRTSLYQSAGILAQ